MLAPLPPEYIPLLQTTLIDLNLLDLTLSTAIFLNKARYQVHGRDDTLLLPPTATPIPSPRDGKYRVAQKSRNVGKF